jgi:hypothetical protein
MRCRFDLPHPPIYVADCTELCSATFCDVGASATVPAGGSSPTRGILDRLSDAQRSCLQDAADEDREAEERAFYAGQAEGFRLAAEWLNVDAANEALRAT